jgi:hypothetical protein
VRDADGGSDPIIAGRTDDFPDQDWAVERPDKTFATIDGACYASFGHWVEAMRATTTRLAG